MRVDEIRRMHIEQQGKVNKNKSSDAESFQQIMDQMTASAETGKSLPLNINPVQIIDRPNAVMPVNESVPGTDDKKILLDSLKDTLDLIDFYAGKLGDASFPAENLSSLIDQLDDKLESIKGLSSADGMPEKLKPVISDIAVTIGTEIERFKRGDYV